MEVADNQPYSVIDEIAALFAIGYLRLRKSGTLGESPVPPAPRVTGDCLDSATSPQGAARKTSPEKNRRLILSRAIRTETDPIVRTAVGQVRCAIYTRKSTEEGLEQEFNSLDVQREAAEAFILSQRGEGLVALPYRYDDGGFSGGTLDRPALKQLLDDISGGTVDCVIVYKVDRLSRSLIDFARIIEIFERHKVSFVSVTQQFNTTNSLGRLTLNILLSFAQFEREIIAERTRD